MNPPRNPRVSEELGVFLAASVPRQVPPRIAASAKRQVAPTLLLWIGLVFGVLGTGMVPLFFPWGFWHDWQLASAETRAVEGVIVSAETTGMKINGSKVWKFQFEYSGPEGTALRRGDCFTTGQKWRPGDRVQVRYLPSNDVACPEGARTTKAGGLAALLALAPVIGFGLFAFVMRAHQQAVTTLVYGQLTEVRIVSVDASGMKVGGKRIFKVTLNEERSESRVSLAARLYDESAVAFARERMENEQSVYVLYDPRHRGGAILPEAL